MRKWLQWSILALFQLDAMTAQSADCNKLKKIEYHPFRQEELATLPPLDGPTDAYSEILRIDDNTVIVPTYRGKLHRIDLRTKKITTSTTLFDALNKEFPEPQHFAYDYQVLPGGEIVAKLHPRSSSFYDSEKVNPMFMYNWEMPLCPMKMYDSTQDKIAFEFRITRSICNATVAPMAGNRKSYLAYDDLTGRVEVIGNKGEMLQGYDYNGNIAVNMNDKGQVSDVVVTDYYDPADGISGDALQIFTGPTTHTGPPVRKLSNPKKLMPIQVGKQIQWLGIEGLNLKIYNSPSSALDKIISVQAPNEANRSLLEVWDVQYLPQSKKFDVILSDGFQKYRDITDGKSHLAVRADDLFFEVNAHKGYLSGTNSPVTMVDLKAGKITGETHRIYNPIWYRDDVIAGQALSVCDSNQLVEIFNPQDASTLAREQFNRCTRMAIIDGASPAQAKFIALGIERNKPTVVRSYTIDTSKKVKGFDSVYDAEDQGCDTSDISDTSETKIKDAK